MVMVMMLFSACENKKDKLKEGEIYLYYTDKNRTQLKSVTYKPKEEKTVNIIGEVLEQMNTTSKELNVVTAKPEEVMILDYESGEVLDSINIDGEPQGLHISDNYRLLFISDTKNNLIKIYSTLDNSLIKDVKVGKEPTTILCM
jgi:ABC-type enterochelin transport system substrate-binding protein